MEIAVIGGTGLIGSKLVKKLRDEGQEVVAAAPATGINSLTGEGLANALKGASVAVDVTNSPSWEDAALLQFFETSTRNLLDYEAAAGVRHHVELSVVATERMLESGFFLAKLAQENLIKASSIPYSIIRATQFLEFVEKIADLSTEGKKVRLPPVLFQPMAADDVASTIARIAMSSPVNATLEIGGREQFRLDEVVRRDLAARKDPREVIAQEILKRRIPRTALAGLGRLASTADHASTSQMPAVTFYCISVFGHVKRRFGPRLAAPMVVLGICEVAIRGSIDCSDGIPCGSTACSQYAASDVDCDRNSIASSGFQQFDEARLMENLVTSWGLHIPKADGIGLRKCGISLFDGSFPRHQERLAAPLPATRGRGGQHCDR